MQYHPDSTTRARFINEHVHTPVTLEQVICSICRQRCTQHHELVQISGHPECQCVFGKTCILQWLDSGSAANNTCPSCKAVLYNTNGDEEDVNSDIDDDSEPEATMPIREQSKDVREKQSQRRRRRSHAPPPSSLDDSTPSPHHTHRYNLRALPHRQASSSSSSAPPQTPSSDRSTARRS